MLTIVDSDLASKVTNVSQYLDNCDSAALLAPKCFAALLLFEEPSTRTRFSIEVAARKLGIHTIFCESLSVTSMKKGESLVETARILSQYFDVFAIRSQLNGFPKLFSKLVSRPVLNLGDGSNEHPSQALATMVSIKKRFGQLDDIHIVLWGDLEMARTVHSVFLAAIQMRMSVTLIPVSGYAMPEGYITIARYLNPKLDVSIESDISMVTRDIDVLYVVREQSERRNGFRSSQYGPLHMEDIERSRFVLHPLPRGNEINDEGWHAISDDLMAHVAVTYSTRQWLIWHALNEKQRGLDEIIPHDIAISCRNERCATFLDEGMAETLCVENIKMCGYCRATIE